MPAPDDWSEAISPIVLARVSTYNVPFFRLFDEYPKNGVKFDAPISTYACLRELRLEMPRGKNKNAGANDNGSNNRGGARGDAKWIWGNCRLSNEDLATLEQSTDTLDYLATCLASLGNDGFGFTCKPVDEGKSHCCTIFRPDFPTSGVTIGVSAFGGNLRDAILTCLYKLDAYGGGDFTGFDVEIGNNSERPRFR
jgi:hypothetical protein